MLSLVRVGWYELSKVYAYDDMKQKCVALVRRERETFTYVDDVYVRLRRLGDGVLGVGESCSESGRNVFIEMAFKSCTS